LSESCDMQSRSKILILLFTVTLALGTLTLLHSSNDTNAVFRFRSFFSNRTLDNLKANLTSITDVTSLWYGGISLFAIIMIVLVFRAARHNGSQRPRERLIELKPARTLPGAALQEGYARHAKDPASQSLEVNARRIYALENQLREKEELLQSRDGELKSLRSQVTTLTDPPSEMVSGKTEVESMVREELKRMTELLEAKDATITELENSLSGKQQLLQNRSRELDGLKSKADVLTEQLTDFRLAKERAENVLQQELKKTKVLQAKDSIITGLENNLTVTQELLQSRSQELDALKSKMNTLTDQLTDLRLARERAENVLQQDLKKIKALQAKDSIVTELENSSSGRVHALESALSEKQELLQARNGELKTARSKVNTMRERLAALGSAKKQTENVLQQQLKKKTELLQAKDAAMKELQESLSTRVHALEGQLKETEKLLEDRDAELEALGSKTSSLTETRSARKRAQSLLLQELQNRTELLQAKDAVVKELQERLNATVHALESARSELETLMKQRDAELPDQLTKNGPAKEQAEGLLRPDRKGMNSKLLELGAAKARTALSLQAEEAKRASEANDSEMKEPGDQSVLLADKDKVLEIDDGRNDELNTEATKKERN
jgi:chromosome segregation ATPase